MPSTSKVRAVAEHEEGQAAGNMTARIVDAVTSSIVERRLMPGARLIEQNIADAFGVSRTIVRQALNQLSRDHLVRLEPARGACVATPSVDEAREVFEARALIESAIVRTLCGLVNDRDLALLRAHIDEERTYIVRSDVPRRTSLLADFHVVLARLTGNRVVEHQIFDLVNRSSLISLMYQSHQSAEESLGEHVQIVDAIEARDPRAAARLMTQHLRNVLRNLELDPRTGDVGRMLRARAPYAAAATDRIEPRKERKA